MTTNKTIPRIAALSRMWGQVLNALFFHDCGVRPDVGVFTLRASRFSVRVQVRVQVRVRLARAVDTRSIQRLIGSAWPVEKTVPVRNAELHSPSMRVPRMRLRTCTASVAIAVLGVRVSRPVAGQSLAAPTFTTAQQNAGAAVYTE